LKLANCGTEKNIILLIQNLYTTCTSLYMDRNGQ